jgi:hypothetical protein
VSQLLSPGLRFPYAKWAERGCGWQNYPLHVVIPQLSVTHTRHRGEDFTTQWMHPKIPLTTEAFIFHRKE